MAHLLGNARLPVFAATTQPKGKRMLVVFKLEVPIVISEYASVVNCIL